MRSCSSTEASPFPSPSSAGTETRNDDTTSNHQTCIWLGRGMFQKMAHLCLQTYVCFGSCLSMLIYPIGSMYGIYATHDWGILMVNVTIYSSTMDPMGMFMFDLSEALQHIERPNMAHHWHKRIVVSRSLWRLEVRHIFGLGCRIKTTAFYPAKSRCLFLPWAQNKLFCWLFVFVEAKLLLIPADCILFLHTILVPIMTQWLSNGRTPMFFATDGDEREYQPGPRE